MRILVAFVISSCLLASLAACGGPDDEEIAPVRWTEREATSLSAAERKRVERARLGTVALGRKLLERLGRAIGADGPAASVDVCREAAPEIASGVTAATGLRVGRTSHRLRDPANAPPDWARAAVAGMSDDEPMSAPRVFEATDGRTGVLFPIRLKAMCTQCHGDAEALAPGVAERLDEVYPEDAARGFAEGSLRGVFWVEVPAEGN